MINVEAKQKHVGDMAKRDPNHRFKGLYRTLCEETWLTGAWKRICRNKGSSTAGVDGQTKDDVDEALIKRLSEKLRNGEFQPTPVRRVYIPKSNGKKRPLGIPTLQDRIVQSALKMLLEPIYEQDFRDCSHGFRPKRSCMTALKDVACRFYRTTWIIEGDISGCFDNIHHGRLMSILRQRIRDEKLLRLMYAFLQAGYLERWSYHRTYSGTPQGGIISPLLANVYLSELDKFMEDTLEANPRESRKEKSARKTKEYRQIESHIYRIRKRLKEESIQGREELIKELKSLKEKQKRTPCLKTRSVKGYVRYADDYLILLQQHSKAEAERVKEQIGVYLKTHLRLEQNEEKTLITHPTNAVKFLGYNLRSNGERLKGLRLEIPVEAMAETLREVERLCKFYHIEETDLILKVNAVIQGWMNYYRFAAAPQRPFSFLIHKAFWLVSHYLARKNETSIPKILRKYKTIIHKNGRKRITLGKRAGKTATHLLAIPPRTERIFTVGRAQTEIDKKEPIVHEWADGRSLERRIEAMEKAGYKCQNCGATVDLKAHHEGGLRGYRDENSRRRAGDTKRLIILCDECHLQAHGGTYMPRSQQPKGNLTGKLGALKGARPAWGGAR